MKEKVYRFLKTVPKGKVVTYRQIAEHLGNRYLARAVGNILHKNPDQNKYPCYKVVNSRGKLSHSYAFGGINAQGDRLSSEGIEVKNGSVDLSVYQYKGHKE